VRVRANLASGQRQAGAVGRFAPVGAALPTTAGSHAAQPAGAGTRDRPRAAFAAHGLCGLVAVARRRRPPAPDPKEKIAAYETLRSAQRSAAGGRDRDVIAALEPLLAHEPDMLDAWELLARVSSRSAGPRKRSTRFGQGAGRSSR
jgi:hypothetical protein